MRLCGVLHLDNASNGILDPLTKNLVLMFSLNPVRYPICKTTRAIVRDSKASCANTAVYNKGDVVGMGPLRPSIGQDAGTPVFHSCPRFRDIRTYYCEFRHASYDDTESGCERDQEF